MKSNSKILLYFGGFLVVGIILLFLLANVVGGSGKSNKKSETTTYNLVLKGGNKIILEEGQKFVDPGYEVLDENGFTVNGVTTVQENINYNQPGKYTVNYIINGETVASREVVIQKKKEEKKFDIELIGDTEMNVLVDTVYRDKGAKATGLNGEDYTSSIVTTNKVNTSSIGKYEITYSLRIDNYANSVTRVVNVVAADAKFKLKGDKILELEKGTAYSDPGVTATYKGVDYSSSVKKDYKIDRNTVGDYTVTYTFKTDDFVAVLERIVKVVETKENLTFTLKGNSEVQVYTGEAFTDPGFTVKNQDGKDFSSYVKKESNVNTNKVGVYTIKYILSYKNTNKTLTRTVKVVNKPAEKLDIDFHLNGSSNMSLAVNTTFTDPGFVAKDSKYDYRDFVTVSGYVNSKKVGTYTLTYTLKFNDYSKSLIRTVKITGTSYQVSQKKSSDGKSVTITLKVNLENFSHVVGPVFKRYNSSTVTYNATKNDTYTFHIYDKNGLVDTVNVKVKDIVDKDVIKPTASCTASVSGTKTKYVVKASDNVGIKNYKHNGKTYSSGTFTVNNDVEDDTVIVSDTSGNTTTVKCQYNPITAGNKSVYASYSSDTLKYWTERPNNNYYVTHIWVKDAYNQINAEYNTTMGQLERTATIVNNTISKYGYTNKGMFAINASGFIMNAGDSYEKYVSQWRLSSRAPVIFARGKLIRNFTQYALPNNMDTIYGIKSNGYLTHYNLGGGNGSISNNKKIVQKMKDDGIRNTVSFSPVLVQDHKVVTSQNGSNLRQAICQIDRNNFIVVTNITTRAAGWGFKDLANYMVSLNCRTAYNLDGGGSINVYYKKNNSKVYGLVVTSRAVADILYFAEK